MLWQSKFTTDCKFPDYAAPARTVFLFLLFLSSGDTAAVATSNSVVATATGAEDYGTVTCMETASFNDSYAEKVANEDIKTPVYQIPHQPSANVQSNQQASSTQQVAHLQSTPRHQPPAQVLLTPLSVATQQLSELTTKAIGKDLSYFSSSCDHVPQYAVVENQ